jgi:hypothetical protein
MISARGVVAGLVCVLALVVNPAYFMGCGSSVSSQEEDFEFGERELVSAVAGTWEGTITASGQPQASFTMTLEQATDARSQALRTVGQGLCGSRSFVKGASACIAVTTMPVIGTITLDLDGAQPQPLSGTLSVYGATFEQGELSLKRADGVTMNISLRPDRDPTEPGALSSGAEGSWTLARP